MPSFAPASSYNAAFEAANSGPSGPSFNSMSSAPSGMHSSGSMANQGLIPQPSNSNPINSYSSIPSYNGQHDSSASMVGQQSQPQQVSMGQQSNMGSHQSPQFSGQQHGQQGMQYASQQYRPDMMSIAASAPVPSTNTYCK